MSESYPFHSTRARRSRASHAVVGLLEDHLRRDRGVREPRGQLAAATCFLDFLRARGKGIEDISKVDVDDFFVEQSAHYTKETIANLAGFLRTFFRLLLSRGVVDMDWAPAIPRPRVFTGKRDPRFLKPREVQAVLAGVDRASPVGKRNFAILTLLALYGLRAAEIAKLRLDDIAWRSRSLRVRHRKCGDVLELPLLPPAASALADYLVTRGESAERGVFLSTAGTRTALRAKTVSILARDAIRRAGVVVARPGSHSFRYAAAQAAFRAERPVSEIAAVLGHRDLRSTLGYLSITVHPLREVAHNDAEVLA